jgi:excisionase family DNA binding protein
MFDPARFYRPSEVWRLSRAPRAFVYDALNRGELRAIRRGARWLIPGSAALEWVSREAVKP